MTITESGLYLLAVEVTSHCNLQCPHCYGAFNFRGHPMSPEWPERIGQQAFAMGVRTVTITGGEPLTLGDDLQHYIEPFTRRGLRTFLTTNGIGIGSTIGRDHIKGLAGVQISLDGGQVTHDRMRGRGRFEEAVDALRTVRDWGFDTAAMMTLHAANVDDVGEVIEICQKVGASLSLERYSSPGRTDTTRPASQEDLAAVYRLALEHGLHSFDPCYTAFGYWLRGALPNGNRLIQGGCSAGVAALAVAANLDVYTCVRLRLPIGNLAESDLLTLWQDGPLLRSLRDRTKLEGACGACGLRSVCGGCRAHAYHTAGSVTAADPDCPVPTNLPFPTMRTPA